MAEKRRIQFERYTNLPLGGNWAGEWPAYVLVHHEGSVDDVRYVPERTCCKVPGRMKYGRRMPKCSECGQSLGDERWVYCPSCGARIKGAAS